MTNPTVSTKATRELLAQLPAIAQSQADDLVIETPNVKVWLSRLTPEDNFNEDPVTLEGPTPTGWARIDRYSRRELEVIARNAVIAHNAAADEEEL